MKSRLARFQSVVALVLFIACSPLTTHAITVGVLAPSGDPGGSVEVQVYLSGGSGLVAGVQTDMVWDPSCLSAVSASGNAAECSSNPAIPKNLSTNIRSGSTLRAVFLSVSDVEPIAQDTWLFSCLFNIDAATTATQCPVNLVNAILSDSKGGRLPVTAVNGVVQIHQSQIPTATAGPPVSGASGAPGSAGQAEGEGCAIGSQRPGGYVLPWLLIIPVLVRRRRVSRSGA
jgi:hypothetical protein